VAYILTGGNQA